MSRRFVVLFYFNAKISFFHYQKGLNKDAKLISFPIWIPHLIGQGFRSISSKNFVNMFRVEFYDFKYI